MQVIISCAGMGRRISEYIGDKPKCLLQIGKETIIERQIRILRRHINTPPLIVVGYKQEMIREKLKGLDVKFVENLEYATTNTLTSLWYALKAKKITDSLICLVGDVVFSDRIAADVIESKGALTIAVQRKCCDEEAVKVLVRHGSVVAMGKDLKVGSISMEGLGIYKIDNSFVDIFEREVNELIALGDRNAYIFAAIQRVIDKGINVGYVDIGKRPWEDVDFIEDYVRAKEKFKD